MEKQRIKGVLSLINQLQRASIIRIDAAEELLAMAGEAKITMKGIYALNRVLESNRKDNYVRRVAAKTLGAIGEDKLEALPREFCHSIAQIACILWDDDVDVCIAVETALRKMGRGELSILCTALRDEKYDSLIAAAKSLGAKGEWKALEAAITIILHLHKEVDNTIDISIYTDALGEIGKK